MAQDNSIFQPQPMMRKMLYSLVPIYLFAIYMYGWRVLLLSMVTFGAGILAEYLFEKSRGKKVSEAVLITCALFTLSLPPLTPWWIALVGILFAVIISKEAFGGFGRNPFNPAIAGRLFIYLTFPGHLTYDWSTFGNFGTGIDALTTATPLALLKTGEQLPLLDLLIGFRSGSIGETSIILIFLAAIYLVWTRTANWELMVSTFFSAAILNALLQFFGVQVLPVFPGVFYGSLLFISVFIATEPVTAPKNRLPRWIYGALIGCITILIRSFSLFPEGTSFGVLIGNTFASLLDEVFARKAKNGS